jgi:signal transduction histidine kinase/CheY-like chemotaxis protein
VKGSIYHKIKTHTSHTVIFAVLVVTLTMGAGLLLTRNAMLGIINALSESILVGSMRLYKEYTEDTLYLMVQGKASEINEHFKDTAALVNQMSLAATAFHSPRGDIGYPPDTLAKLILAPIAQSASTRFICFYATEQGYFAAEGDYGDALREDASDPRTRPWYIQAKEHNGMVWTEIYEDSGGQGLAVICAMPFYGANGEIAGVAGIGAFVDYLTAALSADGLGETGDAFVLNEKGYIVVSEKLTHDGNGAAPVSLLESGDPSLRDLAARMTGGGSGTQQVAVNGVERFVAYHGLTAVPWSLAILVDYDEVIAPVQQTAEDVGTLTRTALSATDRMVLYLGLIQGLILAAVLFAILYFAGRLAKTITNPINKLTEDAARIGDGETQHVFDIKTGDELEVLADAFNAMINNVKTTTADKERANERAQAAIENYDSLQHIFDSLPIAVAIASVENLSLLYSNQAVVDMFGGPPPEHMQVRNVMDLMPELQPNGVSTYRTVRSMIEREVSTEELLCVKVTGESFVARISSVVIKLNGELASVATLEDMTVEREYKQMLKDIAQKELEANQLKSRFLANMSHEIRTPMNAILGIAEIQLRNETLPPASKDAFNRIYESGDLLLNIINDILDISKIESGKMELAPIPYVLPSLINDTAQLNRLRHESVPISFNLHVDEKTPLELYGDELRVKQILNNILSNAFKYTDEGEINFAISVETEQEDDSNEVILVFRISDTGQGMTPDEINRIFDDYTRFNPKTNRTVVGVGLGMSITKHLIDLMDGQITIESEPGKGSTFIVRLPQRCLNKATCGPELAENLENFNFHSTSIIRRTQYLREYMPYGTVLVVDDVASNIYVTQGMLLPYGLNIETVESGAEAVQKIKNGNTYDVIFMDHMMPVMDGVEATRQIREMGYTGAIVALTANALLGRADMFLENGFDRFISKPIDSRELNLLLNELIRNKKPPEVVEAARQALNAKQAQAIKKEPAAGGTKFTEVQEYFLMDASDIKEALNELYAKLPHLNDEDFEEYTTAAHGIKSALHNIGEWELSAAAYVLEHAGEERDVETIQKETPGFVKALGEVVEKLKR